ncbi:hypothetical protein BS78_08G146000 [Paspalum vaginatum]|nr:hypothetical protein BS78_08G146000 [Paspalum vaginatum]
MESPRPLPALPNDPLEEIFLRIASPADLVRASAASVNFRLFITDPSFLRRYRSLHPPLLLGLIEANGRGFQPAEAPHPSAALGRAVARAADFSFEDYLPPGIGGRHYLLDVQGGRVLLRYHAEDKEKKLVPHLAVCDPLARRCLLLPPIHEDRFASVGVQNRCIDALLVPSGDEEDDTSFRVIARMICTEMVVAFIFSSATGHWSAGTSVSWDALNERVWLRPPSYLYSCFYWKVYCKNKWLKFDMSGMEFSTDEIIEEPGHDGGEVIIAEAGEGRVGMFRLNSDGPSLCYTIISQIVGKRFDQLKMDNMIPLPVGYWYHSVDGPYEGHIFIQGCRLLNLADNACFTLEIKTLKIERVCQMRLGNAKPYFGFPPFMSPVRV